VGAFKEDDDGAGEPARMAWRASSRSAALSTILVRMHNKMGNLKRPASVIVDGLVIRVSL
jgi:hypothetical protein